MKLRILAPLVGLIAVSPAAPAAAAPHVTPVPGLSSAANSIVAGADGALWATVPARPGRVARITPAGAVTYPGVGGIAGFPADRQPSGLTVSAGTFWLMLSRGQPQFARMTADGATTPFSLSYGRPTSLVGGPDGALWLTVTGRRGRVDAITRFRPDPLEETRFSDGLTRRSNPRAITVGPDGALWFAERDSGRIGRITTSGELTFQTVGGPPAALAAGPLDSVWYAQGTTVRRVGDTAVYTTPSPATALAAGPDGALWAAVRGGAVRIVPGEPTTMVSQGIDPAAHALAITAGPDGQMWMTLDREPYLVKIAVPPRIDTGSVTASGGSLSVTVNPNGLATVVTAEVLQDDGTWRVVAEADAGAGTTPTTVTVDLTGLPPGEHVVRLTITNAAGSVSTAGFTVTMPEPVIPVPASVAPQLPAVPQLPASGPVQGRTVAVRVVSGTVKFRRPGAKTYTRITGTVTLELGVVLDTTKGKVVVTSEIDGETQSGTFNGGKFSVTQTRTGLTEVALAGPLACGPRDTGARASFAKKKKKKRKRLVWGSDSGGNFRTRGTSSVATVRGTKWRTMDTCEGTQIYVRKGAVSVWPRSGGKSRLVRAGQRLFTPRP